jgi:hypothetical protein
MAELKILGHGKKINNSSNTKTKILPTKYWEEKQWLKKKSSVLIVKVKFIKMA